MDVEKTGMVKKKSGMRRMLSCLLTVCLLAGMLPSMTFEVSALEWHGSFSFDKSTGTIYQCNKNVTRAVIPEEIDGVLVTAIRPWAFDSCQVEEVVIPDSITKIDSYTFIRCNKLKSIRIPDSVTYIGYKAFTFCDSLSDVDLPDGLTGIGEYAFWNCSSLTEIEIPESVVTIESNAFCGCDSLSRVIFSGRNIEKIGASAFSGCTSLKEVDIPDSLTSISSSTFSGCSSLSEVRIPESITSIGSGAFAGCSNIKEIQIPESVATLGNHVFRNCSNLVSIQIPDNVMTIGSEAFQNCSSLSKIEMPDSVQSIGEDAFSGCTNLRTAGIVGSGCNYEFTWKTKIPDGAFWGCEVLNEIEVPDTVTDIGKSAFQGCSNLKEIKLSENIKSIGNSAFAACVALKEIQIPGSVKSIGWQAFADCSNLTQAVLLDGVVSIGGNAFSGCNNLSRVVVPQSVTSMGRSVFLDCISLKSAGPIGSGASYEFGWEQKIPNYAFEDCESLSTVELPDKLGIIGRYAFSNNKKLNNCKITENVNRIDDYAFYCCSSLNKVALPSSIKIIGEYAFFSCGSLQDVYYASNEKQWNKITISQYNDKLRNATIHYNSTGWVDSDDVSEPVTDVILDKADSWLANEGTTNFFHYLCNDGNFTNSAFVYENDAKFGDQVVIFISDLIFRGMDGWKDLFDAETSVKQAESILIALLEGYQADVESLTAAQTAGSFASCYVSALREYMKINAEVFHLSNEDMQTISSFFGEEYIAGKLEDGKFDEIIDDAKKLGYTQESPVVKTLEGFHQSEELASALSGGLKLLGDGLQIMSMSQDIFNKLYEVESMYQADEIYSEMLLYLAQNCKYSVVQDAAKNVYDVLHGGFLAQTAYVTEGLGSAVEEAVINEALDLAIENLPYGKLLQAGFDLGVMTGNLIFHTADSQIARDSMRSLAYISNCLSVWVNESRSEYYLACLEEKSRDERLAAAEKLCYATYMLIQSRKCGEESLGSYLAANYADSDSNRLYVVSQEIISTLNSNKEYLLSQGLLNSSDNVGISLVQSVVSCPVDVEVYQGDELIWTVRDGEEANGIKGDIYYSVSYQPYDNDYIKILSYPEDSGYSLRLTGKELGLVGYTVSKINREGSLERKSFSNVPVKDGTVISIEDITMESTAYTVTNGIGNISDGSHAYDEISDQYIAAENITLENEEIQLKTGERQILLAKLFPENVTDKRIIWKSDNEAVASVNSDGVVTGLTEGTAVIICSSADGEQKAQCIVTVTGVDNSSEVPEYTIKSLQILNNNGQPLDSIPSGEFYIDADLLKSDKAADAVLVLAAYDPDGKMLHLYCENLGDAETAETDTDNTVSRKIRVENPDGEVAEVRAFVLRSLGMPVSLCSSVQSSAASAVG